MQFWQHKKHRLFDATSKMVIPQALSIPHFSFKEFINEKSSLNLKVYLNASFSCKTYPLLYLLLQVTKDLAPLPLQYYLNLFKASLSLGKEARNKVKEVFPWQYHLDILKAWKRQMWCCALKHSIWELPS